MEEFLYIFVYTNQAKSQRLLVGAIDFGTSYSGWAFSFKHEYDRDPTIASIKNWQAGNLSTDKTPTCLLVKPDGKTFQAFGYDAENIYRDLVDSKQNEQYYFFKYFKMELMKELGKGVNRKLMLKDLTGKQMKALDVFAMSIKFRIDDMIKTVTKRLTDGFVAEEIYWVLTVPAIWSDASKQLMRESANKAGIANEMLTLALEPEAASMHCRHIPVERNVDDNSQTIAKLPVGSKYLILDAGGGTVDMTVHEVHSTHTLREVQAASGGNWGGRTIDQAFERCLIYLIGKDVYNNFINRYMEDWLDLFRELESAKRGFSISTGERVTMRVPISLFDLFFEKNKMSLLEHMSTSEFSKSVEIKKDKVRISNSLFLNLFTQSTSKIIGHLKSFDINSKEVSTIVMVGGYSECALLQEAIQKAFPDKKVVIPLGLLLLFLEGH